MSEITTLAEAKAFLGLPPDGPATLSVPEGGRLAYGLSPSASYEAAKTGGLPGMRYGERSVRVSILKLAQIIAAGANEAA